ncbi:hypothetical protein RJ639_030601 [Escallonia herrerae]|uniref:Uncharacterized protein n=1 Tax=Escallonia herrerae TaxID=1293975 RepID=A0AA88XGR3_9ASTE|nr:hypothetical protein RJ639_030601 [Escallonia herrerae]
MELNELNFLLQQKAKEAFPFLPLSFKSSLQSLQLQGSSLVATESKIIIADDSFKFFTSLQQRDSFCNNLSLRIA